MSLPIELTEAILKELLPGAMLDRGTFYDIDNTFIPGVYTGGATSSTGTYPEFGTGDWKYGTLEVLAGRGGRITHRLTSERGSVAVRVWTGSFWREWIAMTST